MSDAPERIWLEWQDYYRGMIGTYEWTDTQGEICPDDSTGYIRADIAAKRELELQMTIYAALEMLQEGNGMRAMEILRNQIHAIESAPP